MRRQQAYYDSIFWKAERNRKNWLYTFANKALLVCAVLLLSTLRAGPATAQTELNVRDVDIRAFVEIVAEATGRGYTIDERVRGTVTVVAPEPLGSDAIYEIFLDVLELNRLTLIQGAQTDRIVPAAQARELSPGGARTSPSVGGFETQIITLSSITIEDAVNVIRPLVAQEAVISPLPRRRQIILTDRAENLERVTQLLARIDQRDVVEFETIRVRFGSAADIATTIDGLGILSNGGTVSAEPGVNAIVVSGDAATRSRVRTLVRELDRPQQDLLSEVVRLNYADASSLAETLNQSFGAGTSPDGVQGAVTVVPDVGSNSLLITAPSERLATMLQAVAALDQQPRQVLVEAVIFELSMDSYSELSSQFGSLLDNAVLGVAQFSTAGRPTLTGLVNAAMQGTVGDPGQGGSLGLNLGRGDSSFLTFLTALASESSTRLLSTPSIMTLNNTEAEIVVAQNVPFVTGSFSTIGNSAIPDQPFQTISRQDIGLTLRITPQITGADTVRMQVVQEVSNLTNNAAAAGGEITSRRALRTNVLVGDGRVIMLGGLLENGSGAQDDGVPGLQDIRVIGNLFRGRTVDQSQRVLLMLLRPRVMASQHQVEAATLEASRDAAAVSAMLANTADGRFPALPNNQFPFDGFDLTQPFGAGLVDDVSIQRGFPPLPPAIVFGNGQ